MTDLIALYQQCRKILPSDIDLFASQEGEDILIRRLLKTLYWQHGTFIDVGAYHPVKFSTTLHYYMRGWRGINVEPNPDVIDQFNTLRPHDVNLNMGISDSTGHLDYYRFKEPAFNTFDSNQVDYALTKTQLVDKLNVHVNTLKWILDTHLTAENRKTLRFMNIDVEGHEMHVLRSNDWSEYRPPLVLVEALTQEVYLIIHEFMNQHGYLFVARTKNTYVFAEESFKREYVD